MRQRAGIFLVLAASALVLIGVTAPPGALRFLIRSPIVLVSDLISAIRQAFAPSGTPPAGTYVLTTVQPPASITPIVPSIGSFVGVTASTSAAAPALPRRPLPIPMPVSENPVVPLPDPGGLVPPPEQVLDPVQNVLDPVLDPVEEVFDPILDPVEKAVEPVVDTVEKAVEPVVGTVEKAVEPVVDAVGSGTGDAGGGAPDVGVPDVKDALDKLGLGGK